MQKATQATKLTGNKKKLLIKIQLDFPDISKFSPRIFARSVTT